jgi:hypothetical protein
MRIKVKPFNNLTEGTWRPIRSEVVRWGRDANDSFLWRMGPLSLRSCLEAELRGCLRFLQRPKDKRTLGLPRFRGQVRPWDQGI